MTSIGLCKLFGAIRAVEIGGLPWQGVKDATGKSSTMAEEINADPAARDDVAASMKLLFAWAKTGKAGRQSGEVLKSPAFAFGFWCSNFTALREELRGIAPKAPAPAKPESFAERDRREASERAQRDRARGEREVEATNRRVAGMRPPAPMTPEQQAEVAEMRKNFRAVADSKAVTG